MKSFRIRHIIFFLLKTASIFHWQFKRNFNLGIAYLIYYYLDFWEFHHEFIHFYPHYHIFIHIFESDKSEFVSIIFLGNKASSCLKIEYHFAGYKIQSTCIIRKIYNLVINSELCGFILRCLKLNVNGDIYPMQSIQSLNFLAIQNEIDFLGNLFHPFMKSTSLVNN